MQFVYTDNREFSNKVRNSGYTGQLSYVFLQDDT